MLTGKSIASFFGGLLILTFAAQVATAQKAKTSQPNILFIVSDDHSAPFLSSYGYPSVKTPNIDKLAEGGILYRKAFTTAPQCVLSRAAIMTGRSTVDIEMTRFSAPLPADIVAYPELLRKAGYYTGLCGRTFHLDGSRTSKITEEVFDKYHLETFRNRVDYMKMSDNSDSIYNQYTGFLDKIPKGKPFFVQVGFSDPHRVFTAKEFEPNPDSLVIPPLWPDTKLLRQDFAAYLGEIQRLDKEVGHVLDELKRRGLEKNTLIVFIGDNGGALVRGKGTLYNLGLNVPLIMNYPGVIKPGQSSNTLVSGEDIAPTFLQVAGVPIPKEVTGVSLVPSFDGKPFKEREYVYAVRGAHGSGLPIHSSNFDLGRTIISGKYKLIYNALWQLPYYPVDFPGQPFWLELQQKHNEGKLEEKFDKQLFADRRSLFELFDEEKDPYELKNLAGKDEYKEVEAQLKDKLQEWMILNRDYLPLPVEPYPRK